MNLKSTPQAIRDRVSPLTKLFYGLGTALDMWGFWLYAGLANGVFVVYLGMDVLHVNLALFLIRIIDAFVDPLVGWISDNLRTKWGRRRPFILIAGVLSGLGLPILFLFSPDWADQEFLGASVVFWYMLASNLIYIPIISSFSIPWNSLGPELSPDYDERSSVMTYRSVMQKFFEVGNFFALKFTTLAWFVMKDANGNAILNEETGEKVTNTLLGAQVYTSILGVIMAILAIIIFFQVKERYYDKVVEKTKKKLSFGGSIKEVFRCRPFRLLLGMGASFSIGTSMVGSMGYFATVYYVCKGHANEGNDWNFWVGLAFMVGGLIGAPILKWVADKIEKRAAVLVASAVGALGYGGSWFLYTPAMPELMLVASCLMGFAASAFWMLNSSIGADIIDYDELNTGIRREGAFTAYTSYILKFFNSLGFLITGVILTQAGFFEGSSIQSENTQLWIRGSMALLPTIGFLFVVYFISRMRLSKKVCEDIREQLEERRGTV